MLCAIAVVLAFACTAVPSTYARDLQERWAASPLNLLPGAAELNSAKLAKDASGNLILGGNSDDEEVTAWIVQKYDGETGILLWKDRFVPPGANDTLSAVAIDPNGDVFALGRTLLRKYRGTDGTLLWQTSRAGFSAGLVEPLAVDAAGDVFVTGSTSNPLTASDVHVIKFSGTDGAIRWQTSWTSPSNRDDSGKAIKIGPAGEVIVAGNYYSGVFNSLVTLELRADNGEITWAKTAPADSQIEFVALASAANGNVAAVGLVNPFPKPASEIYVAVYTGAAGDLAWEKRYRGPNATAQYVDVKDIAMDAGGNVIVAGRSHDGTTVRSFPGSMRPRMAGCSGSMWSPPMGRFAPSK